MSYILDIPLEIREQIIAHVLVSSRTPPPDVATASNSRLEPCLQYKWQDHGLDTWDYGPRNVKFERTDYASNSLPLLLVNCQISDETKAVINRLSKTLSAYTLDATFVDETEIWPTWTSVPVLLKQVDRVEVTFRIFGTFGDKRSGLRGGCGGPPQILWCFYFLLEYFLKRGITADLNSAVDRQLSIKTLVLNFVSEGDMHLLPPKNVAYGDRMRALHGLDDKVVPGKTIMRPEWLASFINSHIFALLFMNYHTARYGALFHERIGSIQTLVDGKLKRDFDVAAILGRLAYDDPTHTFGDVPNRDERLPRFWQWKRDALLKREELGFPAPLQPAKEQES